MPVLKTGCLRTLEIPILHWIISIISHDLRNPLTSVKLLLDMAIKQNFSEQDFKKFLPIASKDVNYTMGLLNNLLHWSSSQMKGERINQGNFRLDEIIPNVIKIYEREAFRKKIVIRNSFEKIICP